jgi:hypothetical protein
MQDAYSMFVMKNLPKMLTPNPIVRYRIVQSNSAKRAVFDQGAELFWQVFLICRYNAAKSI